jgi:hypothetical protein
MIWKFIQYSYYTSHARKKATKNCNMGMNRLVTLAIIHLSTIAVITRSEPIPHDINSIIRSDVDKPTVST